MPKYQPTDIMDRFEEAVQTLKRLPKPKVQGHFNTWPPIVYNAWEIIHQDKLPIRLGPPSPDAIDRMDETFQWLNFLEDDERRLVVLRAENIRWKKICYILGKGRTTLWHQYRCSLIKICLHLNHQSSRQRCSNKKVLDTLNRF